MFKVLRAFFVFFMWTQRRCTGSGRLNGDDKKIVENDTFTPRNRYLDVRNLLDTFPFKRGGPKVQSDLILHTHNRGLVLHNVLPRHPLPAWNLFQQCLIDFFSTFQAGPKARNGDE